MAYIPALKDGVFRHIIIILKLVLQNEEVKKTVISTVNQMVDNGDFDDVIHGSIKSLVISEMKSVKTMMNDKMKKLPLIGNFVSEN